MSFYSFVHIAFGKKFCQIIRIFLKIWWYFGIFNLCSYHLPNFFSSSPIFPSHQNRICMQNSRGKNKPKQSLNFFFCIPPILILSTRVFSVIHKTRKRKQKKKKNPPKILQVKWIGISVAGEMSDDISRVFYLFHRWWRTLRHLLPHILPVHD